MRMRTIPTALAGMLVLGLTAPPTQAADRFAVTCIFNKTNITLNYERRWGNDDPWKRFSVRPGAFWVHRWEYPRGQEGRSPRLYLNFDDDLSAKFKRRDYYLLSYRSKDRDEQCRHGKRYRFRHDGKGFIDMSSSN